MNRKSVLLVLVIMLIATLLRLFPFMWNFSPIAAIALLGGYFFKDIRKAILVPIACLLIGDLALQAKFMMGYAEFPGFYPEMSAIYLSFGLVVLIGRYFVRDASWDRILFGSLFGSIVFFLISNFAVWMSGHLYPLTLEGLGACFTAAIPFFRNTLAGDMFYAVVLFGAYKFVTQFWFAKQTKTIA